ncbi:MAG: XRE family transcriptional regulator [Candidatus Limivivens sp.]|nr:XRE family transcriptional regulator [Candidatus Limivivens sp.]
MSEKKENLNEIISANLKRIRRERNLTLDEMAGLTGVSRSMLGQIERGESSPSVGTLWKVAVGLKISFTALMKEEQREARIIDNKALQALTNGDERFRLYTVFPFEPGRNFEILYIEMDPGVRSESMPHETGTEEFTLVYEGELILEADGKTYAVQEGQSIHYKADVPHAYGNQGKKMVRLCMVIYYQ